MAENSGGGWGDPGGGAISGGYPGMPPPEQPHALDIFIDDTHTLLIKGTNEILSSAKPRDIYNNINKEIPNVIHCKRLQNGDYILKVKKSEKEKISRITKIGEIPVTIGEAWSLNITKVTVHHWDFPKYTDDELTQDLKAKNSEVISAEIQKYWKNNALHNTEVATVTLDGKFSKSQIERKQLGLHWEKLNLQLYLPPPTRCKICWAYDHYNSKKKPCQSPPICGHCGQDFHLQKEDNKIVGKCENPRKCINCHSTDHAAWSVECPKYKEEQLYWDKATKERITYKTAKAMMTNKNKKKPRHTSSKTKPA